MLCPPSPHFLATPLNFMFHIHDKKFESVMSHDFTQPQPSKTVTPSSTPPLDHDILYGRPMLAFDRTYPGIWLVGNVPSKLCVRTQIMRRAHTRKLGAHIKFCTQKWFLHIFHTCHSKFR